MIIGHLPKNVSNIHKELADILSKGGNKIYVEYPVKKLLLNFWERNETPYYERDIQLLAQVKDLSFDFFNETSQIVIEVQGQQHHKFTKFFHGNIGNFDIQKINDKLKVRVCKEIGMTFATIDSDFKGNLEEFLKNIINLIPK